MGRSSVLGGAQGVLSEHKVSFSSQQGVKRKKKSTARADSHHLGAQGLVPQ